MSRCETTTSTLFFLSLMVSDQRQSTAAIEDVHGEQETKGRRQGEIESRGKNRSQEERSYWGAPGVKLAAALHGTPSSRSGSKLQSAGAITGSAALAVATAIPVARRFGDALCGQWKM